MSQSGFVEKIADLDIAVHRVASDVDQKQHQAKRWPLEHIARDELLPVLPDRDRYFRKPVAREVDEHHFVFENEYTGLVIAPLPCNNNGICEPGETCTNCLNDCTGTLPPTGFCGDGICDMALAEDCVNCAADCAGVQSGNPGNRYCCGAGGGQDPVTCQDPRCTDVGFDCGTTAAEACCGDDVCDSVEDSCSCAADCGAPLESELVCNDGIDDDCDGQADCGDLDCCTDALCIDGIDGDGDGVADCDCDDGNNQVWATPGEATDLSVSHDVGVGTTLDWVSPVASGSVSVTYETLRTGTPDGWMLAVDCVPDGDPSDTTNLDTENPDPDLVYYYLVRASNACPEGVGPLGQDSGNAERTGASCP